MKRKSILLACSAVGIALLSSFAAFYPGGAPAGVTGSPGDGSSCAKSGCHSGAASSATGWITSTIPAAGYVPGQTYQITATNSLSGSGNYGFEVSPQNTAGTLLGTLVAGTNSQLVGSGKYVTHTSSSTTVQSWTFPWTAPVAGTGAVTFYGAFSRSTSGPTTLSTLVVSEQSNTGIPEPAAVDALVSDNHGNGQFTVSIPQSMRNSDGTLKVLDASGKPVYSIKYASNNKTGLQVDISKSPGGVYVVMLQNASGNKSEKIILK
jgi:hypothetical protein